MESPANFVPSTDTVDPELVNVTAPADVTSLPVNFMSSTFTAPFVELIDRSLLPDPVPVCVMT